MLERFQQSSEQVLEHCCNNGWLYLTAQETYHVNPPRWLRLLIHQLTDQEENILDQIPEVYYIFRRTEAYS